MWQSIQKCRIQKIFRGGYLLGRLSMKEQPGWLESICDLVPCQNSIPAGDRVGPPYEHCKRPRRLQDKSCPPEFRDAVFIRFVTFLQAAGRGLRVARFLGFLRFFLCRCNQDESH